MNTTTAVATTTTTTNIYALYPAMKS